MEEKGVDWTQLPIIKNQPILWPSVRWIFEGFLSLSAARQLGFSSAQPIELSSLLSYIEIMGITDPDEKEDLLYFVQSLDQIFLTEMASRKPPPKSK